MISTLHLACLIAFLLSSGLYLLNLHVRRGLLARYGTVSAVIGFGLGTLRLFLQIMEGISPFSSASEAVFFLSWAIAVLFLFVLTRYRLPAVGSLAMPLVAVSSWAAYRLSLVPTDSFASDVWLRLHVVAIVVSFAMLAVASCCGVFYLVLNKLLKSKKLHKVFRMLPPLEMVDRLGYQLVSIAFPLLTIGIGSGIIGVRWRLFDSPGVEIRLAASALVWIGYGVYLITYHSFGWRGKRGSLMLVLGVALLMITTALHRFV